MAKATLVSTAKCFEGLQKVYRHTSEELKCEMNFSLYLPPQAAERKCPVLYWLSGLTCTERNFIDKSGFQRYAAKHGIIVVGPDTSPRGCNIEGEEDTYDFGTGAGFYVDATEEKWKTNYRMYSYVTKELPALINQEFPNSGKCGIFGHSMGGHGALTIALKNPEKYASISAFAPISNPSVGAWGQRALTGYMGSDRSSWSEWDATLLAKAYNGPEIEILIDQGTEDCYLEKDLMPENFINACKGTKIKPTLRMQQGYEHSYMFVSTFIGEHFEYHAKNLCQ
ncbi:S-formylglutathione hydrolase like protein [Argiope bruennichi]|uniref:S-formylglutathione hydrolase n=1 Tax=Argiope bruennichi TaxID=94029 RepID=A0A8T0E8J9_ARGBR|nr:S-formylglutathione hydrolase like protein [Argiope bruennichi]